MALPVIYIIISPTNRIYVGQTRDFEKRISYYKRSKCKGQTLLHASLRKYGWEQHTCEVVVKTRAEIPQWELTLLEQTIMDHYRSEGYELMNLKEAGSWGKHSEETKLKMSVSRKGTCLGTDHHNFGKHPSRETLLKMSLIMRGKHKGSKSPSAVPVWQCEKDGTKIKRWEAMAEAAEGLNIKYTNISRCCRGTRLTAYGFVWKYTEPKLPIVAKHTTR